MKFVPKAAKPLYRFPRTTQQMMQISELMEDGIMLHHKEASIVGEVDDINFALGSKDEKDVIAAMYERGVFNALPPEVALKLVMVTQRVDERRVMDLIQMPMRDDGLNHLRQEVNEMNVARELSGKHGFEQKRYFCLSVDRSRFDVQPYLNRLNRQMEGGFTALGSKYRRLPVEERLEFLHNFFRPQNIGNFAFDAGNPGVRFEDLIAPDGMTFAKDHFMIGGRYGRVLLMQAYATTLQENMLTELMDQKKEMILAMDVVQKEKDASVKVLERKQDELEREIGKQTTNATQEGNYNLKIPHTKQRMRKSFEETLKILSSRDQRVELVQITIVHMADSMAQLNSDTRELQSAASTFSCRLGVMEHQQREGLNTTLPYGPRYTRSALRPFSTENVATLIPFSTQEIYEPGGIIYGTNPVSSNLVWVNRRDEDIYDNGCGFIFGIPGSGKSALTKEEIAYILLNTDEDIFIIDRENEYQAIVEGLGGQYIRLAEGSSYHINAMEPTTYVEDGDDPIDIKCSYLETLCGVMIDDGNRYGSYEKTLISRCARIVLEKAKEDGTVPTLVDLVACLKQQTEERAKELVVSLERFEKGALSIFAKPTNVNMSNRLVCFGVRDLGKSLKTTGMYVVMDAIFNRVAINKSIGRCTRVEIEEFISLVQEHPQIKSEFSEWYRRFRKYGAIVTSITQNISPMLDDKEMETMLSNSEFVIMLKCSDRDRRRLQQIFHLSESQVNVLAGARPGCGLLRAGNKIVPFDGTIRTDTELYKLLTTKFKEVSQINAERRSKEKDGSTTA